MVVRQIQSQMNLHMLNTTKYISLLLSLLPFLAVAQTPTQTLRGHITDADTGRPLTGATIQIKPIGLGTATDTAGDFRIERVPAGRYSADIRYLGYETALLPELLIEAGKELYIEVALRPKADSMSTVLVTAFYLRPGHGIGDGPIISVDDSRRFPAVFYDPARVMASMPGVAVANDQANGISLRGHSPNAVSWRLEGADIVNPNHTPNAGTFSDRVSAYGGGVNILSSQLLSNAQLYNGPFPPAFGNALSGILDMHLRAGNNERREYTVQAGLIGLDVAAEGPFSKKSKASWLVNYRYSTIGLLAAMGVPLGDEKINFQDLSFHFVFPGKNGSEWTIFGLGGNSVNIFEASRDSTTWEFQKDRYDIRFRSRMGAAGVTHSMPVGKRGQWRTVLSLSALESTRSGDRLDDELRLLRLENDQYDQSKHSLNTAFRYRIGKMHRLQTGLLLTRQFFNIASVASDTGAYGQGGGWLWQPYVNWSSELSEKWRLDAGLHSAFFGFNGSRSLEPRLSLEWRPSYQHRVTIAYGLHSQLQQPQLYFAGNGAHLNSQLGFTRSHYYRLGWSYFVAQSLELQVETYYQRIFDVPVETARPSSFSALNMEEGFVQTALTNSGTGRNYGVELGLRKYLDRDYWWLANATWYHARYTGSDGIERSSRYDGRFLLNLAGGKEWRIAARKSHISKTWGFSGRVIWNGGFRYTPVDAAASEAAGTTVLVESEAFSRRLSPYFRPDLRIYWQRNGRNSSSTFSIDIQNVANRQNLAFYYFDTQKATVVERYQLGIIPVLSWRREF